jgi:hypothetical protein
MLDFLIDSLCCLLLSAGVAVVVAGCIEQPTFVDQCQHCGEYLEDAAAAHAHLATCSPCDDK